MLDGTAGFDQPAPGRAPCPHFSHEQAGKVTQIPGMSDPARLHAFDALQCAPVPALSFSRTTSSFGNDGELVADVSRTRCVPDALMEGQAFAVAAFSLPPGSLLLGNDAQEMPDNGVSSRISPPAGPLPSFQVARARLGLIPLPSHPRAQALPSRWCI